MNTEKPKFRGYVDCWNAVQGWGIIKRMDGGRDVTVMAHHLERASWLDSTLLFDTRRLYVSDVVEFTLRTWESSEQATQCGPLVEGLTILVSHAPGVLKDPQAQWDELCAKDKASQRAAA